MSAWCRACGVAQSTQSGPCGTCGVDLAIGPPSDSPVGLAFTVRGKLGIRTRQGICIEVERGELVVHLAPDSNRVRLPATAAPSDLIPVAYSAAARLVYASNLTDQGLTWDKNLLRSRTAELCADIRVVRWLVDEALVLGWEPLIGWAPLTASEKAWRRAHQAAATGDLPGLRAALATLPDSGYPFRAQLLLPYLTAIRRDPGPWRSVLPPLTKDGAAGGRDVVGAVSADADAALAAASGLAPADEQDTWAAVHRELSAGTAISEPRQPAAPAWTAASLISRPASPGDLDSQLGALIGIEASLLDDLIDAERLARPEALPADTRARRYLLARLDPGSLSEDELADLGHLGELARRLALSGDRKRLAQLPASPRVDHYRALLDVLAGGEPDPNRLDPATADQLRAAVAVLRQLADAPGPLPPAVADDPSLWSMFTEQALQGRLLPSSDRLPGDPLNVWIGLLRLVGLVWEQEPAKAVEHGNALLRHLHDERRRDEALNLTAYALHQLGQPEDALDKLDYALADDYTENLLVNACLVAAPLRPERGVRRLARLVEHAPPDLQRAGLYGAIGVWKGSGQPFPQSLMPALRTALLDRQQPIEDFLRLGRVAANEAPDILLGASNPGGRLDGPFRLMQAEARLQTEDGYRLADLALEYIAVYRAAGRPEWFNEQWALWVQLASERILVDFGQALRWAEFVDAVLLGASELLEDTVRWQLAAQAGAHLAAGLQMQRAQLSPSDWTRLFFHPLDEFLAARAMLPASVAEPLCQNFTRCMAVAAGHFIGVGRDQLTARYIALVERQRWDQPNLQAILAQKRALIDEALAGPVPLMDQVVQRSRRLGVNEPELQRLIRLLAEDLDDWRDELHRLRRDT